MTDRTRAAAAHRRAAALLIHHRAQDVAGWNTVLSEVRTTQEMTELLGAFCGLYETLIPPIFSEVVNDTLAASILQMAGMEDVG